MAQQQMRVRVVKVEAPSATTRQIYEDEFKNLYSDEVIEPPYNLKELKRIAKYSTILQQCVDAYRTNIVGFGLQPDYTFDINAKDVSEKVKKQVENEWVRLEEFIKYLHFDESAETILGYALEDREKTGNGFIEVLRDGLGRPAGIEYVDCQNMRVCSYTVPEEVEFTITENGVPKKIKRWKKFRRYVQMVNGKKVFFKEYGDPRVMNLTNGKFDENTPEHLRATEVIHFKIGSGTYGIPRWIGHIVSLYGARKAEELNYMYFKQGRHTPAAIIVENGMLSETSFNQLQEYMNSIEGVENAHKFLLLEAEGIETTTDTGMDKPAPVKVQIKSLAEVLQQDALFLEYDQKTREKLRSAFRLPPLYTGEAHEYNRATADTARKITEEQVFQPERNSLANKLNTLFLPALELQRVKITLKGPDFRDPVEIAKVLTPFINAGAVSPNDLRDLLGRVLGKTLEEWPEEFNLPFQMILREQQTTFPIMMQKSKEQQNDLIMLLKDMRDVLEELKP
ncbi:phage portal protein, PBSX family [Anoxybacillus sp. B7M1]|uniref:phage portal protein n=1 Tax=unclassified Anoxybacillus TaxID=2639704 RepID=UPI0005CC9CE5|nr:MULTISPECIES: phage portal protein [unclassified Anoxybacillus]ANB57053.1 phage portal protein, PBSX family [Anoxybacillus sp. B2M1]ANB63626.1 phage portal protein, PBSX family [Anoxybacillus sp. B7M1]